MANLCVSPLLLVGFSILFLACLPLCIWCDSSVDTEYKNCTKLDDKGKQEIFTCPNTSDVSNSTKRFCCGVENQQYCCTEEEYKEFAIAVLSAVVIVILVVLGIIIFAVCLLICCCCCGCCYLAKRRQSSRTVVM